MVINKQFVSNRVEKIKSKSNIEWRYLPTDSNPADFATRGETITENHPWLSGPRWLQDTAIMARKRRHSTIERK